MSRKRGVTVSLFAKYHTGGSRGGSGGHKRVLPIRSSRWLFAHTHKKEIEYLSLSLSFRTCTVLFCRRQMPAMRDARVYSIIYTTRYTYIRGARCVPRASMCVFHLPTATGYIPPPPPLPSFHLDVTNSLEASRRKSGRTPCNPSISVLLVAVNGACTKSKGTKHTLTHTCARVYFTYTHKHTDTLY